MALVIEDGSIVSGADSYGSVAGATSFWAKRGVVLGDLGDDTAIEQSMIVAMDYIESLRDKFQGAKVSTTQALQFPRTGVYIDELLVATNAIPQEIINAQYFLAHEHLKGVDLMPTKLNTDRGAVIEKTLEGVVSTKYNEKQQVANHVFAKANSMLKVLFKAQTGIVRS